MGFGVVVRPETSQVAAAAEIPDTYAAVLWC